MNLNQINSLLSRTDTGIAGSWFELAQPSDNSYAVRINTFGPDATDAKKPNTQWPGRYWLIHSFDTEAQVKNTLLAATLAYVEHEARERFKIDGKALYEPAH